MVWAVGLTSPARKHLPWWKHWDSWFTTPSHAGLSPIAMNLGAVLMSFANASPSRSAGELRVKGGRPVTASMIARKSGWTAEQVVGAMAELVVCETVTVTDGVWALPEFLRWQQTPEAARKARSRDKSRDKSRSSVTGQVTTRGQRSEVRGTEERSKRVDPDSLSGAAPDGHVSPVVPPLASASADRAQDPTPCRGESTATNFDRLIPRVSAGDRVTSIQSDGGEWMEPMIEATTHESDDPVQRVYDAWRAHHPTAPKAPKAKGGPAGAIRGRLSEGYEPAQLIEAIEHNHNDEWASSIGKHELTYVLRSAETTTRWLEWRPPTRTPTANERGLANLFEMAKGVRR